MIRAKAPLQHFQTEHKTCEANAASLIGSLSFNVISGEQRSAGERCQKQNDNYYLSHLPALCESSRLQMDRPGPGSVDFEVCQASVPVRRFQPQFRAGFFRIGSNPCTPAVESAAWYPSRRH